jgi:hypothetical protein
VDAETCTSLNTVTAQVSVDSHPHQRVEEKVVVEALVVVTENVVGVEAEQVVVVQAVLVVVLAVSRFEIVLAGELFRLLA